MSEQERSDADEARSPNQPTQEERAPLDASVDPIDPEGWMSERPTYWLDLPQPAPPTRLAWLRHRAREFATWLQVAESKAEKRPTEEEWIQLSETALGPLPRPDPAPPTAQAAPRQKAAQQSGITSDDKAAPSSVPAPSAPH